MYFVPGPFRIISSYNMLGVDTSFACAQKGKCHYAIMPALVSLGRPAKCLLAYVHIVAVGVCVCVCERINVLCSGHPEGGRRQRACVCVSFVVAIYLSLVSYDNISRVRYVHGIHRFDMALAYTDPRDHQLPHPLRQKLLNLWTDISSSYCVYTSDPPTHTHTHVP